MRKEALNDNTRAVWEKCGFLNDNFYLAGGTALALQLNHRRSVDLDFFSGELIKKTLLKTLEEKFKVIAIPMVRNANELTIQIQGVKTTFLHYPFALIEKTVPTEIVSLASVRDIAGMKAYALGRRGTLKDYIDLYTIFSRKLVSLKTVIDDANKKYKEVFNDRLFCEQLLYTDDIEDEPIEWIGELITLDTMKVFFKNLISNDFKKPEIFNNG